MIKKFNNIKKTKRFQKGGAALAAISAGTGRRTRLSPLGNGNSRHSLYTDPLPPIGRTTIRNNAMPRVSTRRASVHKNNKGNKGKNNNVGKALMLLSDYYYSLM